MDYSYRWNEKINMYFENKFQPNKELDEIFRLCELGNYNIEMLKILLPNKSDDVYDVIVNLV